jgi:hypothetical protein
VQAFALCKVREWDLSYKCLTSPWIQARLHKKEAQKTQLWREQQASKANKALPRDNKEATENLMPRVDCDKEDRPDDSDISSAAVIATVAKKRKGCVVRKAEGGGLCSAALAEDLELDCEPAEPHTMEGAKNAEEGRSRWARRLNWRYFGWGHYNDEDDSDVEEHGMGAPHGVSGAIGVGAGGVYCGSR